MSITKTEKSQAAKSLTAEQATLIALDFLKWLGNKRGLKPRKVSLENENYVVEVELKNGTATIQINSATRQIKEYTIESKTEETEFLPVSFKAVLLMVGISVIVQIIFSFINLNSFF